MKSLLVFVTGLVVLSSVSVNGFAADPPLLLDVDFDKGVPGLYAEKELAADWRSPRWSRGVADGRVSLFDGSDAYKGNSLRVIYPIGAVGMRHGGAGWRTDIEAHDSMCISYRLRFREGFKFVRGGKLPGLGGGRANTGGHRPTGDGWSARFMWLKNATMSAYVYHMDQPTKYGEHFKLDTVLETGRWYSIKLKVTLNTVGKKDGLIIGWLDGKKVVEKQGLRFRSRNSVKVDKVLFETFFGGGDPSYAPLRNEYIDFDEFKVWSE